MNAMLEAAPVLRWADRLSPAQREHLRLIVSNDDVLPPIEEEAETESADAIEKWLRTTVKATCERVDAGEGFFLSLDESLARVEARLVEAV
ncbi:MAG: hypothetical protein FWD83_07070 [Promicromonosporaceae bacterium]|nr:hypothetical protein [Promicromonosporaceae bacterium]